MEYIHRLGRFVWQTSFLIVIALVVGIFAGAGSAWAASVSSGPQTQITTETIHLNAAQCARIRKAFPQDSCTILHTTQQTVSPQSIIGGGGGCPSGSESFTDKYTDGVFYQLQIITQFYWNGKCGLPTGTGPYCQVNWSALTMSNQQCYYWYSSQYNATEGKYTVFVGAAGVGYTAGVYRGCRADASCYSGWI
jgi:hypothetical protein